jgi:hypothetical protein
VDAALRYWGESGRRSIFTVSGQSMEPFLFAGDQLLIRHGGDNIHTGGLIAYRQEDSLVVHRLLRIFYLRGEKVMLLRGDNNDDPDPLIPIDKLVGCAIAVNRGGKTYQIDTPLWRWTSRLIALFARFPLTLEQWSGGLKRRWFPDYQVAGPAKAHRRKVRSFALPGRFLIFLLWKFSRYDQL